MSVDFWLIVGENICHYWFMVIVESSCANSNVVEQNIFCMKIE